MDQVAHIHTRSALAVWLTGPDFDSQPTRPRTIDLLRLCTTAPRILFQVGKDRGDHHYHHLLMQTVSADAFHSVGPTTHLALLPQENSIFGTVTETYDLMRSSTVGESKWIRGAVTLSVQHCLVVRRGKTLPEITKVLSHEQVSHLDSESAAAAVASLLIRIASHHPNLCLGLRTVSEIHRDASSCSAGCQRSFYRCGCRSSLEAAGCRQQRGDLLQDLPTTVR